MARAWRRFTASPAPADTEIPAPVDDAKHVAVSRRLGWLDRFRIQQCVGAVKLSCGCHVGRYMTYAGGLISIIDQRASGCEDPSHAVDMVVAQ